MTKQPFEIRGWKALGGISPDIDPRSYDPSVLDQTHEQATRDDDDEFIITQSAVEHLAKKLDELIESGKIDADTKEKILIGVEQLEGRTFGSKGEFLEALELNVGKETLKQLKWRHRWSLLNRSVKSANVDQKYRITAQGLKHLPNGLSGKLKSLEDRLFVNKDDFKKAVKEAVAADADSAVAAVGGDGVFNDLVEHTKVKKEFQITDDVLGDLKDAGVSKQLRNRLNNLKWQTFIKEDHFLEAVEEAGISLSLGDKQKLLQHAEAKSAFKITDKVLQEWQQRNVADFDKLQKLKGQIYTSSRALLDAVAEAKGTTLQEMDKQEKDTFVRSARVKIHTPSRVKRRRLSRR